MLQFGTFKKWVMENRSTSDQFYIILLEEWAPLLEINGELGTELNDLFDLCQWRESEVMQFCFLIMSTLKKWTFNKVEKPTKKWTRDNWFCAMNGSYCQFKGILSHFYDEVVYGDYAENLKDDERRGALDDEWELRQEALTAQSIQNKMEAKNNGSEEEEQSVDVGFGDFQSSDSSGSNSADDGMYCSFMYINIIFK